MNTSGDGDERSMKMNEKGWVRKVVYEKKKNTKITQ